LAGKPRWPIMSARARIFAVLQGWFHARLALWSAQPL